MGSLDTQDSPRPGLGEATIFPLIMYSVPLHGATSKWFFLLKFLSGSPEIFTTRTLIVTTIALGLRPMQGACKVAGQEGTPMSHFACS
jgi:hypothetical protein